MSPELVLKIKGEGVTPNTVDLGDLIDLLKGINSAFAFRPKGSDFEPKIALTKILEGSDELYFETDPATSLFAFTVLAAMSRGDFTKIPAESAGPLRKLWKKSATRGWKLEISTKYNAVVASAVISPENELFAARDVEGSTSQVAFVIRVGAEKDPTAAVRLANGEIITAHIATQELSRQLAEHLYNWVELRGEAHWAGDDWKLAKFDVTSIGPYFEKQSDPIKSLNDLAVASGGFWDTVDPTQYIRDLRSND